MKLLLRISPPHLPPFLRNHAAALAVPSVRHELQFEQPKHWHFSAEAEYSSEADAIFGKRGPAWMRPASTYNAGTLEPNNYMMTGW